MKLTGQKVLVTGAEGFIGSHLTELLVRTGCDVTALAQYESFGRNGWLDDLNDDIRSTVEIQRGDIRDSSFVQRIVEGKKAVFHLAALIAVPYSYIAPQSYVDVNVSGTLNVLEACRNALVERMVHTSTSEVYGTAQFKPISEEHPLVAQSPYAASKIGADMMVASYARSFDLPAVILRPFNTYGPRQSERAVLPSMIRQAIDPECDSIRVGNLTPIRDFNYVVDIAEAFVAASTADGIEYGTPYNAGSGDGVNIGEAAKLISEICGTNKPIEEDHSRYRPAQSEVFELLADAAKLRQCTSWSSRVEFRQGLTETISWWRQQSENSKFRRDNTMMY
jgi:NAD dependent epimerase/dehydratase